MERQLSVFWVMGLPKGWKRSESWSGVWVSWEEQVSLVWRRSSWWMEGGWRLERSLWRVWMGGCTVLPGDWRGSVEGAWCGWFGGGSLLGGWRWNALGSCFALLLDLFVHVEVPTAWWLWSQIEERLCYGRIVLPLAFILWSGNGSGVDSWEVGRVVMFGTGVRNGL